MPVKPITSDRLAKPVGPFSPAVRHAFLGTAMHTTRIGSALLIIVVLAAGLVGARRSTHPSIQQDLAGIERLHRQDSIATLSDDADQLVKLWDKDGVRFPIARLTEVGAATIYADDKQWQISSDKERSLCYDAEIQDIQLAGDWAFEWGYGSYKTSKAGKTSIGYAKMLRVMRRQSDGSWRFARVMAVLAPSASGVVLKHPCR